MLITRQIQVKMFRMKGENLKVFLVVGAKQAYLGV